VGLKIRLIPFSPRKLGVTDQHFLLEPPLTAAGEPDFPVVQPVPKKVQSEFSAVKLVVADKYFFRRLYVLPLMITPPFTS
jgi:hypothetical protein